MPRHAAPLLPAEPGEPLYRRAYRSLRTAILSGALPEGARLPGSRQLAEDWHLGRNTVLEAVELLLAEGYLTTRPASGTYVSPRLPGAGEPGAEPGRRPSAPLSQWAERALAGHLPDTAGSFQIDFRIGGGPTELFPSEAWASALSRRAGALRGAGYGDQQGPLETRQALAAYLSAERGLHASPEMVMLTSGSQGSLDAVARLYLEPGRVVAVEDPGYPAARRVFAATGAQVVPVPVDEHGLLPDALPQAASLLYLTPAHQFPTGALMPAERRLAVLAWAERSGAWIIEDDYNSEFRFDTRPVSALQGLAPESVIFMGTFSKSLAPALRSGYLVAPRHLTGVLARTRPLTDRQPPTLDALALADFLASGGYARHLRRARALVGERAAALLAALEKHLPSWRPLPQAAGLHLYAHLSPGLGEAHLLERAASAGVGVSVLGAYATLPQPPAALLAYSHLPPELIWAGVERLAASLGAGEDGPGENGSLV